MRPSRRCDLAELPLQRSHPNGGRSDRPLIRRDMTCPQTQSCHALGISCAWRVTLGSQVLSDAVSGHAHDDDQPAPATRFIFRLTPTAYQKTAGEMCAKLAIE